MNKITFLLMVSIWCIQCAPKLHPMKRTYNPVVAHRGAWKTNRLPENSIAALKNAIDLKCQGSEFDVRMTRDEVLIINHDEHHHSLDIEKTNYADLIKYPLTNGEKLPTLNEYMTNGKNKYTRLIVEIKPSPQGSAHGRKIAQKVYAEVKKQKLLSLSTFISFDIEILKELLKLNKKLSTQYLNGDKNPAEIKDLGIQGIDYHYSVFKTHHPEWIDEAKKLGLELNAWTVNEKTDLEFFIKNKFNQITTNEPELLKEILNSKK